MPKCLQIGVLLLIVSPLAASAATRTWKDQSGDTMRAEFMGVKDGKVVLKRAGQREYHALSIFSLEDRDFIVKHLLDRKQEPLLIELMNYENSQTADDDKPTDAQTAGEQNGLPSAVNPAGGPPATDGPKKMYGLDVPSLGLVQDVSDHEWTDLRGNKVTAAFEQVVEPGHVRLKPEGSAFARNFSLVNFVKADIDYIKATLKADLAAEVFPPGQYSPLTADQQSKGYRTWTDRKGVQINGKFETADRKDVTLEVDGKRTKFRLAGFGEEDRAWITAEVKRKEAEARRKAEAERQARASSGPTGRSGIPGFRSPFRNSPFSGGGARMPGPPQYKHSCRHCGRSWTNTSPFDKCSNCKSYICFSCGNQFTITGGGTAECPRCKARQERRNAQRNSTSTGSNGFASSRNSTSGPGSWTPPSIPSTPSTPTFNAPPASDTGTNTAYETGKIVGILTIIGGVVGVIIKLVMS